MKDKFTIFVLLGITAGFAAGLMSNNLIAPAYANDNVIINVKSKEDLTSQCNFNKTIVLWGQGYYCAQK